MWLVVGGGRAHRDGGGDLARQASSPGRCAASTRRWCRSAFRTSRSTASRMSSTSTAAAPPRSAADCSWRCICCSCPRSSGHRSPTRAWRGSSRASGRASATTRMACGVCSSGSGRCSSWRRSPAGRPTRRSRCGPGGLSAFQAWLGLVGFTLQMYYGFSGYSDMGIGLARMVGIRLPENFRWPYVGDTCPGFLAALAHRTVRLVSRVRRRLAGRRPRPPSLGRPRSARRLAVRRSGTASAGRSWSGACITPR